MQTLARLLATAGGVGYVPVASGTFGALVVVPFLPWLVRMREQHPVSVLAVVTTIVVLAVWSADRTERALGRRDDGRIVVDEVAGMVVAGALLPAGWPAIVVAFLLFRLFDVVKPPPAGWIDRTVHGGIGVVGDDLVAGLYAGLATRMLLLAV